jgi:hypothetical protein
MYVRPERRREQLERIHLIPARELLVDAPQPGERLDVVELRGGRGHGRDCSAGYGSALIRLSGQKAGRLAKNPGWSVVVQLHAAHRRQAGDTSGSSWCDSDSAILLAICLPARFGVQGGPGALRVPVLKARCEKPPVRLRPDSGYHKINVETPIRAGR